MFVGIRKKNKSRIVIFPSQNNNTSAIWWRLDWLVTNQKIHFHFFRFFIVLFGGNDRQRNSFFEKSFNNFQGETF